MNLQKQLLTVSEFLTNLIDITNSFKNSFFSVTLQSTIKETFELIQHYVTDPCVDSFLISPCIKKEVLEIISNFGNKKATRIHSIPLKILKLAKQPIAEHLCRIFNLSFTTGIFPDSLKIAKVTPRLKT